MALPSYQQSERSLLTNNNNNNVVFKIFNSWIIKLSFHLDS